MRGILLVFLFGCGGGGASGEPAGPGTLQMTVGGGGKTTFGVGAAVQDTEAPSKMLVQLGTDNVDCATNLEALDEDPGSGKYVFFSVDKTPATTNTSITVLRLSSTHASLNSSSGNVMVTGADVRVTGSVTFATQDSDDGEILVAGTFDVKRCF